MCGYQRHCTSTNRCPTVEIDLDAIDSRLQHLNASIQSSSYSKQKSSLHTELESFLSSLPVTKSIQLATPLHVLRFLVWKDHHGKTVLHAHACPDATSQSQHNCNCPTRLAFKTIDSYIGEVGCTGPWNTVLGFGNPTDSLEVRKYLKAATEEQLRACINPKQAVPLFLPKLLLLARFWNRRMSELALTPSNLFLLARDQAFFKTLFFSADRGSDLGLVQTRNLAFPSG